MQMETQGKQKKKLGLSTKIFIALSAGAVVGVMTHYLMPAGTFRDDIFVDGVLYLLGTGFIRLMQMLVVPLVFCSLVCGSLSIGDSKTLGRVGIKAMAFYVFTTVAAVLLSLVIGYLLRPGDGMNITQARQEQVSEETAGTDEAPSEEEENGGQAAEVPGLNPVETLLAMIPKNIFAELSAGNMVPIIIFALFVGIMLARLKERTAGAAAVFRQLDSVMMEMTMTVMKLAPVGVFCLIARTFAGIGFTAMLPMLKYILSVAVALAVQCFIVYQILLFVFTRLNPLKFLRKFLPVMAFAFSTSTSAATIPLSIRTLEEKMGVEEKIASFTIPLGATVNMDGTSIMQGIAVMFIAQAYGITLTPQSLLVVIATATASSIGTAGVPSVGIVTLSMVLTSVGLPTEGIALIMGIDRIVDMMRTTVNVTGDAVCTAIVAHQQKAMDRSVFDREA